MMPVPINRHGTQMQYRHTLELVCRYKEDTENGQVGAAHVPAQRHRQSIFR